MATMAMDTVASGSKYSLLALSLFLSAHAISAEVTFIPSLSLDETYSDNVQASEKNEESTLVSAANVGINAQLTSRVVSFELDGKLAKTYYSHDHSLDQTFNFLNSQLLVSPWASGPQLGLTANITNIARSSADNIYADLISGNTVEVKSYNASISQNINNSTMSLGYSISSFDRSSEDGISDNNGYQANLRYKNGSGITRLFWDVSGNLINRKSSGRNGENYSVEAKLGFNTPIKLSPFVRYFDEDFSGNIASPQNNLATSSLGAGLRWEIAKHFLFDLSYNIVDESRITDNYVEATIDWQPSARTSLVAKYNQRFFGDSYNVQFSHQSKRFTNTLSYDESIQAFERNNFFIEVVDMFCVLVNGMLPPPEDCLPSMPEGVNPEDLLINSRTILRVAQDDQFSLYKTLSYSSELALSRTTFRLNLSQRERENLNNSNIDEYQNASFTIRRRTSRRGDLLLSWRFNKVNFNTNGVEDALTLTDYYRTVKATYSRTISNELTADLSIENRNRNAERNDRNYSENRVALNIKKEF